MLVTVGDEAHTSSLPWWLLHFDWGRWLQGNCIRGVPSSGFSRLPLDFLGFPYPCAHLLHRVLENSNTCNARVHRAPVIFFMGNLINLIKNYSHQNDPRWTMIPTIPISILLEVGHQEKNDRYIWNPTMNRKSSGRSPPIRWSFANHEPTGSQPKSKLQSSLTINHWHCFFGSGGADEVCHLTAIPFRDERGGSSSFDLAKRTQPLWEEHPGPPFTKGGKGQVVREGVALKR